MYQQAEEESVTGSYRLVLSLHILSPLHEATYTPLLQSGPCFGFHAGRRGTGYVVGGERSVSILRSVVFVRESKKPEERNIRPGFTHRIVAAEGMRHPLGAAIVSAEESPWELARVLVQPTHFVYHASLSSAAQIFPLTLRSLSCSTLNCLYPSNIRARCTHYPPDVSHHSSHHGILPHPQCQPGCCQNVVGMCEHLLMRNPIGRLPHRRASV